MCGGVWVLVLVQLVLLEHVWGALADGSQQDGQSLVVSVAAAAVGCLDQDGGESLSSVDDDDG